MDVVTAFLNAELDIPNKHITSSNYSPEDNLEMYFVDVLVDILHHR